MKKVFLLLILFLCVGCSNGVKKVAVKDFDFKNMKLTSYVDDKHNQKIDKKYSVANKHFEYVENIVGSCSIFNKVNELPNGEIYLTETFTGKRVMDQAIDIYKHQNGRCSKMQSLNNLSSVADQKISYKNKIYVNVMSWKDEINQSGLWVLDSKNKKHISKFRSLAADFDIDRETGNLYTLEFPEDGASYLKEYNQADKMINQYKINDEHYERLFIKDGKINLLGNKVVGKKDDEKLTNYVITTIPIKNFFNDLKNKKYEDVIELETNNEAFNSVEVMNDYIAFYGGNDNVACKISNWQCWKYANSLIELGNGQGYIGINIDAEDDEGMYLNKFGTNEVDKLLDNAQTYFTRQEDRNIYFQVFDINNDGSSKTIKYTLK